MTKRFVSGCFTSLPNDWGPGKGLSTQIAPKIAANAWHLIYQYASVIGLAIAIGGMIL